MDSQASDRPDVIGGQLDEAASNRFEDTRQTGCNRLQKASELVTLATDSLDDDIQIVELHDIPV